jgi:hypothetical protein
MVYFTLETFLLFLEFGFHTFVLSTYGYFGLFSQFYKSHSSLADCSFSCSKDGEQLLQHYFKKGPHFLLFTNPISVFGRSTHKPTVLCCSISNHVLYNFMVLMVKDLQPLQVLACELMLHVVNVCIFFSLHAAMFLGMDCLDF